MVIIDINTPVVEADRKFFALHSGQYKEFIDTFHENNVVFLDIPVFFGINEMMSGMNQFKERIVRARKIVIWHRSRGSNKGIYPTTDLSQYENARQSKSVSARLGNVHRLYQQARQGDFVIVPGDGLFSEVLIGRFVDNPGFNEKITLPRYPGESVPIRKVEWLATPARMDLTKPLSQALSRRRAITEISNKNLQAEILQYSFQNYAFGDSSKQYFSGESYDDSPYAPVSGLVLFSALLTSINAYINKSSDQISDLDIYSLAEHEFSKRDINNFEISFASPGGFRIWSENVVLALSLSALIAATGAGISYAEAKDAQIANRAASVDDPCNILVQDSYRAVMEQLGVDRYNELCRKNEKSQKTIGLKSGADVKNVDAQKKTKP